MPLISRSAPICLRTIAVACLLVGWAASATAQPTVVVRDTFTGTNGVLLDAHPPDLGGPWVTSRTADLPNWGAGADLPVPGDYDGDGRTDPAVFRPSTGYWFILLSSGNYSYGATMVIPWGASTDLPTPGDYDGDHKTDIAIYRPSTGYRWILTSSSNFTSSFTVAWGISTDVPVMGDFDGDHSTDIVIYRPSTGEWWGLYSSTNYSAWFMVAWGASSDIPVPGDYDGDGKADITVYRPSSGQWFGLNSTTNNGTWFDYLWGLSGDLPVPGDYDGDGRTDLAVYRPSTGQWIILRSSTNYAVADSITWGDSSLLPTDIVVPGDYDGDGRTDLAVYQPATGGWLVLSSIGPALENGEARITGAGVGVEFATVNAVTNGSVSADLRVAPWYTWVGIVMRYSDPNNFLLARYQDGEVTLYRRKAGVYTTLGWQPVSVGTSGVHRLRVDAVDATIRVMWDGATLLTVADTESLPGTRAGLAWWSSYDTISKADNFLVDANVPPLVALTAPANGASYIVQGTATIPVAATASDLDGSVTHVDFYSNNTLIGTPSSPPYAMDYSGVGPGTYAIRARAYDSSGGFVDSATATVTVAPCQFAISQESYSATPAGGNLSIGVSTTSGCGWSAESFASWLHVTSGASGSGSGTTGLSIDANATTSSRTGTATIAGKTLTVIQDACSFAISPSSYTATAAGESLSIGVTTTSGCGWSADSAVSWLHITSGASGSGSGTSGLAIDANPTTSSRTGTATIAGKTLTVTQDAACSFGIAPSSVSVGASSVPSGTVAVTVLSGVSCGWSATGAPAWVQITGGASGTGSGTASYSVNNNTSADPRQATLTIAGLPFTIAQDGYCAPVEAPGFSPAGGTYTGTSLAVTLTHPGGATVRYTLDGTAPTSTSLIYNGPLTFQAGPWVYTVKAQAFSTCGASSLSVASYVVNLLTSVTPTANPEAGTYNIGQVVTLSTQETNTTIRYTVDGSEPTESSAYYNGPLTINQPTTLKARAFQVGFTPSEVATLVYALRLPKPTISPASGSYSGVVSVSATMTSTIDGSTIRYTTDRTIPTSTSNAYNGLFAVVPYITVKAAAFKSGWVQSDTATETYHSAATLIDSSPAVVSASGASSTGLSAVGGSVQFVINGAAILTDPATVRAYKNGARLSESTYQISSQSLNLLSVLSDGENHLDFEALDTDGVLVSGALTAWAGSRTLTVTVVTTAGTVIPGATVSGALDIAGHVQFSGTTNSQGQVSFGSLPSNVGVRVSVAATDYSSKQISIGPLGTVATVVLDLANNDFSQGLAGWSVSAAMVSLIQHSEASLSMVPCFTCPEWFNAQTRPAQASSFRPSYTPSTSAPNRDVVIDTRNTTTPQTISRVFATDLGTKVVKVRYRFQSDERYGAAAIFENDWYTISMTSSSTGQTVSVTSNVANHWNQFDANAATPWQTLLLPTDAAGDSVTLQMTVANATDQFYLSALYADVVTQTTYAITSVSLRDLIHPSGTGAPTDPYASARPPEQKPLTRLSASSHSYYDGYVRVHGAISITVPPDTSLQSVYLEVLENGIVRATGQLARTAVSNVRSVLLNQQGSVSISESNGVTPLLFEIPSSELATLNQSTDDRDLRMRVRATTTTGIQLEASRIEQGFVKLVLFTGTNRSFLNGPTDRDSADCIGLSPSAQQMRNRPPYPCGGDGWALPSLKTWASGVTTIAATNDVGGPVSATVNWNDFSNMNGGFFPIHAGHWDGDTADGWFQGYDHMDETAARLMLNFLQTYGQNVDRVLVGFSTSNNCTRTVADGANYNYWRVIHESTVLLPNGKLASQTILNTAGHCDHFDVRLIP